MNEYIPYTYYIYCKPINKGYYGVKYSKNCNPKDFFVKYFTSSKIIHLLLETYGKDAFHYEIRKTFKTPKQALEWEQKVLRRMGVMKNSFWLNRGLSGANPNFYNKGEEPWNKGVPNNKSKGKKFYNNGEIQRMYFPGDEPDGWKHGRLNKAWNKDLTIEDTRVKNNIEKRVYKNISSPFKGMSYEERFGENAETIKEKIKNSTLKNLKNEEHRQKYYEGIMKRTKNRASKLGGKK